MISSPGSDSEAATLAATVTAVEAISERVRRFTLEGPDLIGMTALRPAQWLRLEPAYGPACWSRAYTIRTLYPGWGAIELDIALHEGEGPAARWARRAATGAQVRVTPPRGGHAGRRNAAWRLIVVDESAFPAAMSLLRRSRGAAGLTRVIAEAGSAEDLRPLSLGAHPGSRRLVRSAGSPGGAALAEEVEALDLPPGAGEVFVAGEVGAVTRIARALGRKAPDADIHAAAYWRSGPPGHVRTG